MRVSRIPIDMRTNQTLAKRALLAGGILLLGFVLCAYLVMTRPHARPRPPQEKAWPVPVLVAHYEDLQPRVSVFGEIVAGREAEIRSTVAGRIVELDAHFRDGAFVRADETVARIDAFEYDLAVQERSAELAEARARLAELRDEIATEKELLAVVSEQVSLRERDFDRSVSLVSKRQASEKAEDEAALAVNAAQQTLLERGQTIGRLTARIDQQEAAISKSRLALERAKRDLSDTRISAPFTGYASDVTAAIGKRMAVGESLARLIDASSLEARFELPDADYARLISTADGRPIGEHGGLQGLAVEVLWHVGQRTFTFEGEVTRSDAEIDPTTGGVGLYAEISAPPAHSALRPGAFVEVQVSDVRYEHVITVPEAAVSEDGIVYVIEDDRLIGRQVEILREFGDRMYIRGDVAEGERIVAEQFPNIGPGLKIQPL